MGPVMYRGAALAAAAAAAGGGAILLAVPPDPGDPVRHRPLWVRALNALGDARVLPSALLAVEATAGELASDARRAAGLADMGEEWESSEDGLRALVASFRNESRLTTMGWQVARGVVTNALAARLNVVAAERADPAARDERVAAPIIVMGLPRTGTTFLHGLLAQDPNVRYPAHWEYADTRPPSFLRRLWVRMQLTFFEMLAPKLAAAHDLDADAPEECVASLAMDNQGAQHTHVFPVPGYDQWLWEDGERGGFGRSLRWHRRVLRHLQRRDRAAGVPSRPWLLKTPWFITLLPELAEMYPDARFIHTHRDPAAVLSSLTSTVAQLYGLVSDDIEPRASIAARFAAYWRRGLQRGLDARAAGAVPPERIYDVQFPDLLADPVGTVRKIYAHLGIPLTAEAERAMTKYAEDNAQGKKHGRHHHSPQKSGVDIATLVAGFRGYVEQYNISSPTLSASGKASS